MLSEKDLEMLNTISALNFLTTSQIHSLHGNKQAKYGLIVTRRKLKALEDNKFLQSWQPSTYDSKVWYLTKNGARELSIITGKEDIKVYSKSNTTLHQIMVSEVYCTLRNARLGRIRRFELNKKLDQAVCDAFIEFQMGNTVKLIALEADRGTERMAVIKDKLENYSYSHLMESVQKHYDGVFPTVVFITTSDTRKRSILRLKDEYEFRIKVLTLDDFTTRPAELVY